jgi:hypothetical protein
VSGRRPVAGRPGRGSIALRFFSVRYGHRSPRWWWCPESPPGYGMNTHRVAETATAAMSRRTVESPPDVLSFMLLTSSRTTWISPKWPGVQMTGLDLALTEVHKCPSVRRDEGRLVRVCKESRRRAVLLSGTLGNRIPSTSAAFGSSPSGDGRACPETSGDLRRSCAPPIASTRRRSGAVSTPDAGHAFRLAGTVAARRP